MSQLRKFDVLSELYASGGHLAAAESEVLAPGVSHIGVQFRRLDSILSSNQSQTQQMTIYGLA